MNPFVFVSFVSSDLTKALFILESSHVSQTRTSSAFGHILAKRHMNLEKNSWI